MKTQDRISTVFCPATMLMKTRKLYFACHDIHVNKRVIDERAAVWRSMSAGATDCRSLLPLWTTPARWRSESRREPKQAPGTAAQMVDGTQLGIERGIKDGKPGILEIAAHGQLLSPGSGGR